jgi:integral membrane protein
MFSTIGLLRITGFAEGLSFLFLLGIAMPLKYMLNMPVAVQITGMIHGVLFIIFILLSVLAKIVYGWPIWKMFLLWIASIVPFGTFYADYKLLRTKSQAASAS